LTTRLEGKVAFITGAGRGQGRAHAIRLAQEGVRIIAVDLCTEIDTVPYPLATKADLDETSELVSQAGGEIFAAVADVRDLLALEEVVRAGVDRFGRLDGVVANAGIVNYASVLELAPQAWVDMMDVNLTGVFWTVKAALPHIVAGGRGGSIVLTSSVAGLRGIPNSAHYVTAKTGLVGLMRALAVELGPHDIRVNTIHPGSVNTAMLQNEASYDLFLPGRANPTLADFARINQTINVLPMPWAESSNISDAVAFLLSDESRVITGAALPADSGMSVHW
jgi:SDR family mycofactocin-dependent oxidoreductase